jgi:hypothetical protein
VNETAPPANPLPKFRRPTSTVDALEFVVEIESRYPVDQWRAGDLRLWPLVRYDLCSRNYFLVERVAGAAAGGGRLAAARERVRVLGKQSAGWLRARVSDSAHEDRLRPANLLLYSDGASFARVSDQWVDKFCDPLADIARERGLSSLVITPAPLGTHYVPRRTPSVLVQPAIDLRAQLAAARARLRPREPVLELEGFDDLMARLTSDLPGLAVCDRDRVRRIAVYVDAFTAMYRRMLRRIAPRAVLVVCYYGAERMAMLRAARQLGIPSADIQHGAASTHWAYAKWTRLPPDGYDTLPSFFWCWDDATVAAVDQWSTRHRAVHRSVHGGNPFLDQWKTGDAAFVREHDDRMRALVAPHARKEQVLLTGNGHETPEQIRSIASLVAATGDRMNWWIRMHPCGLTMAPIYEKALEEAGAKSWILREPTEAPLYGLLRFMDFHVTETSSTMIEAAQMGVPSVFATPRDAGAFAGLVREGWALPVDGFGEVERGLAVQRERRAELRASRAGAKNADASAALSVILGEQRALERD